MSGAGPTAAAQTDDELRALLPAVEPDRTLDDWGRSERVEALFDRTVADFLYHLWFRCEVEGVENIPATGGALLVSNHSGALPPDAPMIAKAIKEEHPHPRPLQLTMEHFFKGYPGLSMLLPKIGGVPAHPANVHRLLHDEEQLVLVFPEGAKGTEKLYKDRYRLRRFGRGGFVEVAMRAESKIVPICVVGAEEAQPVFAQVDFLRKLTGLIYFPITPTFPWLGPLGMLAYLPAKFTIRFLEPIDTVELGAYAYPIHTDFLLPSISCRFSWIRALISWATVCTRARSLAASAPPSSTVSIGSRNRIVNLAGR